MVSYQDDRQFLPERFRARGRPAGFNYEPPAITGSRRAQPVAGCVILEYEGGQASHLSHLPATAMIVEPVKTADHDPVRDFAGPD